MPRGSSSEYVHSYYREAYETSSSTPPPSTINSLNTLRSNPSSSTDRVGSELGDPPNDREYAKDLILSKYFSSSSTYENLCSGCGYGVFAARGKLCNFCQYVLNGYLEEDNSNIYENICDKCSELYSGVECSVCSQNNNYKQQVNKVDNISLNNNNNSSSNKSTSKKLKKRLLHSLFGSLKRVKSNSRKLQIVHNVDGYDNVFRTNETFDLSRICELKRLKSSASDQHIYGKLRKTDDHLQAPYECVKQKSQSDDYLIGGSGCDTLFRSASENSHDSGLFLRQLHDCVSEWMTSLRCETHDYSSFGSPDTVICNPKSIPANFTTQFGVVCCSGGALSDQQLAFTDAISEVVRLRSFSDESPKQLDLAQQMVNEFKRSLMEKQQAQTQSIDKLLRKKRQGIYLKLDGIDESTSTQRLSNYQVDLVGDHHNGGGNNCFSPLTARSQAVPKELTAASEHSRRGATHQLSKRCGIYEKDSEFVSDILQAFDLFLQRESEVIVEEVNEDEVNSCIENETTNEVLNDHSLTIVSSPESFICCFAEKNINIETIIQHLLLSKSLNKIVIFYDAPLKVFLSAIDRSHHRSALKFPKLFKKFHRFQVFLSKRKCHVQKGVKSASEVPSDPHRTRSLAIEYKPEEEEQVLFNLEPKTKQTIMTVPNETTKSNTKEEEEEEEEPIYQPIWKFKTVGEVQENNIIYEYYDHSLRTCDSSASLSGVNIEDHDEWEPDDEFTFTTKLDDASRSRSSSSKDIDTLSVNTTQSSSGSTITGYASSISTMTIASSSSVTHHIFRNICIFYSPKEPKIRAVLYDYDRNHCSSYFAQQPAAKQTGPLLGVTSCASPPTTSAPYNSSNRARDVHNNYNNNCDASARSSFKKPSESGSRMFADSVQAWKYMLLDVDYLEDEEDMIVSESQILKAQAIKEMESTPPPPVGVLQRFKSISSGNLLDMPAEEDKKSITERVRNKLQRGVFKLQTRSPKENKKSRNIFRRNEATSLYLEDGMKPKYPIFRAPLEQLEMNDTSYPDVPRFVVDCIEYIEQKDCIQMDGLYRASGNKLAVDELKQKLTESYIYDPKLLVTDDIHTLTSLVKLFFRELATPLIPQETYQRLAATKNLMESSAIESMKTAFSEMRNPNRATLKFLIKHLTTVAHYSNENRMPASNLAIVWGPCILSANQIAYDIARMNTLAKVLIENYDRIFGDNERLVS